MYTITNKIDGRTVEVGPYRFCQYRYDIDISDPKYRRYRYRYP